MLGKMAVHAVVASVELSADEPFPEGRIAGVKRLAPGLVPIEQGSVMVEAFGKTLFVEFFDQGGVLEIGLCDEFLRRTEILLFLPVDGDLRLSELLLALRNFRI